MGILQLQEKSLRNVVTVHLSFLPPFSYSLKNETEKKKRQHIFKYQ